MDDVSEATFEKAVVDMKDPALTIKPAKAPRKPRPSELAKKAAKAAGKTEKKPAPAKTKAVKPKKIRNPVKAGKKVAKPKKAKTVKPAKKRFKKQGSKPLHSRTAKKVAASGPVRSERMDLRLSKKEKALIQAKAKKLRRKLTSLFVEFVEKIK